MPAARPRSPPRVPDRGSVADSVNEGPLADAVTGTGAAGEHESQEREHPAEDAGRARDLAADRGEVMP